jgi:CRISPR-associated endoribonuclease Cas6
LIINIPEERMRIKLSFRPLPKPADIFINYQYHLSAAIYATLSTSSPDYSTFLHDHGYMGIDGKPRKLFTFSKLLSTPRPTPQNQKLIFQKGSRLELIISSPMLQEFVLHLISGLFARQQIILPAEDGTQGFDIEQVETIADPVFGNECRFKTLSPLVVTTRINTESGVKSYYYRPLDPELPEALRKNLLAKHQTAFGRAADDERLDFIIDQDYITRRGGPDKISKLIHIRQGHPDETGIKAFEAPFTLKGSPSLMRVAWECGLGDKCSMGFGCVDAIPI